MNGTSILPILLPVAVKYGQGISDANKILAVFIGRIWAVIRIWTVIRIYLPNTFIDAFDLPIHAGNGCENFGVLVMKRIMLAIVLSLVLLWNCNPASAAKGPQKGKGGSSGARSTRTRGKTAAPKSNRYIRPKKAQPPKTSTRPKVVRVEKPKAAKALTTREKIEKAKSQKSKSPKDSAIPRVKEQKQKPAAQGKKDRLDDLSITEDTTTDMFFSS